MASPQPCKRKRTHPPGPSAAALYVHVPFCLAKCSYCDFYSLPTGRGGLAAYVDAATRELAGRAADLRVPLASVFIGGGTPTALGADLLWSLLSAAGSYADGHTEFTVEANPCTIDEPMVAALVGCGVNRVSLGVQSLDADELALLGRLHTPEQARRAYDMVRLVGVGNISVDLIYGIPGQGMQSWLRSLAAALELGVEHLSCYCLSIESGTPLGSRLHAGEIQEADEGLQKDCYFAAIDACRQAGLEHYEISNFARPGRRCRHNLTYWRNEPYVGIGPAAASYLAGERRTNRPDVEAYIRAVRAGADPPSQAERLTGPAAMAETLMLALRLIDGADRRAFRSRYGRDIADIFPKTLSRYSRIGAIETDRNRIRLTRGALFAADTILAEFLAEASAR